MRDVLRMVPALACALALVSSVGAQPPGGRPSDDRRRPGQDEDRPRPPEAGGRAGFGGPARPGQILAPFLVQRLRLTARQREDLEDLQERVDRKLDKILTDEQKKQLKELHPGGGAGSRPPGGFAGSADEPPGRRPAGDLGAPSEGGPGAMPQPGEIMPRSVQRQLKLTEKQRKEVEDLQKEVDRKLDDLLTDEQKRLLKQMRGGGFGPGGAPGAFGPPGGFGGPGPGGPPGAGGIGPGFGGMGRPGQVLAPFLQQRLGLTAQQRRQLEELQKEVDRKLDKILTDEQRRMLEQMQRGFGSGGAPPEPRRPRRDDD
jgi:Spy/CpxP family protein refolding chaperone